VLTPEDVLHIPGPGYDGVEGLSPIGVARQGIGVGLAAEEFGARHFGSGSLIAGVLQTDVALEQPQAEAVKKRWQEKTAGLGHAHEAVVLDRGLKWQPIGIPPKDAQFLETRKFAVTDVARLYGVPPHLLADTEKSTSWGTGIEQQNIGLIIFTLAAWMSRIEQRVAKECLSTKLTVDFDTAEILRGDLKSQMEAAGIAVSYGIWTGNEARKGQRLAPILGGDLRTIPSNWSILGDDGLPVHVGGTAPADMTPAQPPSDVPPEGNDADDDHQEEATR
jgi:HK97 family phage portal protein